MKQKTLGILLLLTVFISGTSIAQTFVVPENYKLKTPEDYDKYQPDILACIDWLEATPSDQATEKRQEAAAFFITWLTGSPKVSVTVYGFVADLADKNSDLMIIFLGGGTRFILENPDAATDNFKVSLAGLNSVLDVFEKGKGVKKDKFVANLVEMRKKGELETWLKEHMTE